MITRNKHTVIADRSGLGKDVQKNKEAVQKYMEAAFRMQRQQHMLNRAQISSLKNIKTFDGDLANELMEQINKMETERVIEINSVQDSVLRILESFHVLRENVLDEKKLRKFDMSYYYGHVTELETGLSNFKEYNKKRYGQLEKEGKNLTESIDNAKQKLIEWTKNPAIDAKKTDAKSATKSYIKNNANMSREVLEFQNFLFEYGGHTGGWDEDDHLFFVRLRNKYKNKSALIDAVHKEFPDIPQEKIKQHEDWYKKYLQLKDDHKEAISLWRDTRNKSKLKTSKSEVSLAANEETWRTNLECPRSKSASRIDTKLQIEEWKRVKEEKKKMQDQIEMEGKRKTVELALKKKKSQELKQMQVEQYKREKMEHMEIVKMLNELGSLKQKEEALKRSSLLMKSFREQNNVFIERARERKLKEAAKEKGKNKQLERLARQVGITAERDKDRVMRPTQGWEKRCEITDEKPEKPNLHLNNMPHLGVPTWRRGMTTI